jgi:hypothetical protein
VNTRQASGVRLALLAASAVAACESILLPVEDDPLLVTSATVYVLRGDGLSVRSLYETEISYMFNNRTSGAVFLPNCKGSFFIQLERRSSDGVWEFAWAPFAPLCQSPAIVIDEGTTFADTLRVKAGASGSYIAHQFPFKDPRGTYRIVWTYALSSYDPRANPRGQELPLRFRVSNSFELSLERPPPAGGET